LRHEVILRRRQTLYTHWLFSPRSHGPPKPGGATAGNLLAAGLVILARLISSERMPTCWAWFLPTWALALSAAPLTPEPTISRGPTLPTRLTRPGSWIEGYRR